MGNGMNKVTLIISLALATLFLERELTDLELLKDRSIHNDPVENFVLIVYFCL